MMICTVLEIVCLLTTILYNVFVHKSNVLHIGQDILHHVYENLNSSFWIEGSTLLYMIYNVLFIFCEKNSNYVWLYWNKQ